MLSGSPGRPEDQAKNQLYGAYRLERESFGGGVRMQKKPFCHVEVRAKTTTNKYKQIDRGKTLQTSCERAGERASVRAGERASERACVHACVRRQSF